MDDAEISALIAKGDERGALSALRARLGWPRGRDLSPAELGRYLTLFAELVASQGHTEFAELAAAGARDIDNPDRLYDLGYTLIDAGVPTIGASVLWRCLALVGESEEVVCELMSALESALAYRDALAILEEHPGLRERSFLCRYLYAFNAAMAGELEIVRRALPTLQPDSDDGVGMAASIAAIVERADRIGGVLALDARDLRGWHYVLSGSLLAHHSPFGFDTPMRGRYGWLKDSVERIAFGLDRLAPLARAVGAPCIYAPPGRSHEIVATAVAARLDLPLAPWPAVGVPAPGLVVLYDLRELSADDAARLAQRRPDQLVFAHAAGWTQDAPIAPDVTTLLAQFVVPPWGETPDATVETLAAELAASPTLAGDDLEPDAPEQWAALVAHAWPPPATGRRSRLRAGGPVASNRFE